MHNYANKDAPFESIDELKHLYGADMEILIGADRRPRLTKHWRNELILFFVLPTELDTSWDIQH